MATVTRDIFGANRPAQVFRQQNPRNELIARLLRQGTDSSPVQHPLQAAARVAQTALGAFLQRQGEEKRTLREQGRNATLANALLAGQTAKPFLNPDNNFQVAPGTSKTDAIVRALSSNPDTTGLGLNLQIQDLAAQRDTAQKERDRAANLARDKELAGFKAGLPNPTPLMRNLGAAGFETDTPEFRAAVLGATQRNQTGGVFSGPQGGLKPAVTGQIRQLATRFLGGIVDPTSGRITFTDPSSRSKLLVITSAAEKRLLSGESQSAGEATRVAAKEILIDQLPSNKRTLLEQAVDAVRPQPTEDNPNPLPAPIEAVRERLKSLGVDPVLLDTMLILEQ